MISVALARRNWVRSLALLAGLMLCLRLASAGSAPESPAPSPAQQKRVQRLLVKARRTSEQGKWAEADRLWLTVLSLDPANVSAAANHARALARIGRTEEVWPALDTVVDLGHVFPGTLDADPAFDNLRDSLRFAEFLERVRAKHESVKAMLREANVPADAAQAPSFGNLADLLASFTAEGQALDRALRGRPYEQTEAEEHRLRMRKIAALGRYRSEHGEAPDVEEAGLVEVREWLERAEPYFFPMQTDLAADVARVAGEFLDRYPSSNRRTEIRLARAVATVQGVRPPNYDWEQSDLPRPLCADTLSELDSLAAGAPADPFAVAALGLEALCAYETDPSASERIRDLCTRYETIPEPEGADRMPYDFPIRVGVRVLRFRVDGPPEFQATDLDGKPVSLAALRGNFLLLNFWGPG